MVIISSGSGLNRMHQHFFHQVNIYYKLLAYTMKFCHVSQVTISPFIYKFIFYTRIAQNSQCVPSQFKRIMKKNDLCHEFCLTNVFQRELLMNKGYYFSIYLNSHNVFILNILTWQITL